MERMRITRKKNLDSCLVNIQRGVSRSLKKLAEVSKQAAVDLMKYQPHTWCRAYFSGRYKSMCVVNNMCESCNAWILEGRHKPIL